MNLDLSLEKAAARPSKANAILRGKLNMNSCPFRRFFFLRSKYKTMDDKRGCKATRKTTHRGGGTGEAGEAAASPDFRG